VSLASYHAQLKALLLANAGLVAWARDNFGSGLVAIDGNVEVERVRPREMPALIFELGNAELEIEVGNYSQTAQAEMLLAVVWHEDDPARAFAQRLALPDLMAKAVMSDHVLAGAVDGAWLSKWESDKGVNHPRHVVRFTISGEFTITNG